MDGHPSHMNPSAAARSRSSQSQSQSPSHSAASASATSSIHKRKLAASDDHAPPFPPSLSADTALTSNDDLESISARGGGASDDSYSDDAAGATAGGGGGDDDEDEEEEYENDNDGSSIRNFTAARLDNAQQPPPVPRNAKLSKAEGTVKVEPPDGVKDGGANSGGTATGGAAPAGTIKEDSVKSIFTENIQTSGAYSAREEGLKREEEAGRMKFACLSNDGIDEHMVWYSNITVLLI